MHEKIVHRLYVFGEEAHRSTPWQVADINLENELPKALFREIAARRRFSSAAARVVAALFRRRHRGGSDGLGSCHEPGNLASRDV
jgi:hypothetical protein